MSRTISRDAYATILAGLADAAGLDLADVYNIQAQMQTCEITAWHRDADGLRTGDAIIRKLHVHDVEPSADAFVSIGRPGEEAE